MKSYNFLIFLILFCACSSKNYYVHPTYFTSIELKFEKNNKYYFRFLDENFGMISYGTYTEVANKIYFKSQKDSNCNVELILSDSSFSKKRIYFSTMIPTYFSEIKINNIPFSDYKIQWQVDSLDNLSWTELVNSFVYLEINEVNEITISGRDHPFYKEDTHKFEFKIDFQNHNCAIVSFPENYFNRKDPNNTCYYDFVTLNPFVFTKKGRKIIMDSMLFNLPAESRKHYLLKRK